MAGPQYFGILGSLGGENSFNLHKPFSGVDFVAWGRWRMGVDVLMEISAVPSLNAIVDTFILRQIITCCRVITGVGHHFVSTIYWTTNRY